MIRYFIDCCFLFLLLCTVSCTAARKAQHSAKIVSGLAVGQQLGLDDVTEVKFTKIDGSMSTAARMYTDYGPWHEAVKVEGYISTFIWKDRKLLSSHDKLFTIYTSGIETMTDYYSSILIVDESKTDMLSVDSPFREELIALFEERLKNIKNEEFYRAFWKFHDPKHYRALYHSKRSRDDVLYD